MSRRALALSGQFRDAPVLSSNSRFLKLLLANNKGLNNGTTTGGIAHALNMGLQGYIQGADARDFQEANRAFSKGSGLQHLPEGVQGPPSPGTPETAINALNPLVEGGNEYAGRLARSLMFDQMNRQREIADRDDARGYKGEMADKQHQRAIELKKMDYANRIPRVPGTIKTAEGVFLQNRDGSRGVRLGSVPKAASTSVNMPPMEKEEQKKYGDLLVKREGAVYEASDSARKTKAYLGMAKKIVSDPRAVPSNLANVLGSTANMLGVPMPKGFESRVTTGQAFEGLMGNILAEKLAAQKGPQTDKDADRMAQTLATLKNTPQAKIFLLDAAIALANRDIKKADFYRNWRANPANKGSIAGAEKAWNEKISKVPLFGVNKNSNLPVFYDQFMDAAKQANPGMTNEEIEAQWVKRYGG